MANDAAYFESIELTISSSRIGLLRFLLEGYDGMSILSTIDRHQGLVVIRYVHSFHDDLMRIVEGFSPQ